MLPIDVIVAPFHAGVYSHRVGRGPHRLLDAGLVEALGCSGRSVAVVEIEISDSFEGEISRTFAVKRRVASAVAASSDAGRLPLILAGNCNASVGAYAGLGDPDVGILWFDAHPDFTTPDELTSGYFDSMAVATLAGQCWHELAHSIPGYQPFDLSQMIYCGIRDFEAGQREKVDKYGIQAIYGGAERVIDYAKELDSRLGSIPHKAFIHLDLDCLDISVGKANRYAALGGLAADQLYECMARLAAAKSPVAMTIASFEPDLPGSAAIAAAGIEAARVLVQSL